MGGRGREKGLSILFFFFFFNQVIPADLMAGVESLNNGLANDHHTILLSNYFAQSEALMKGKNEVCLV